jgi:hypothetical protein
MVRPMAKSIHPSALGSEIEGMLKLYHQDVLDAVNAAGEKAVKDLVKKTRASAPKSPGGGDFAKSLTYRETELASGDKEYTWGAAAPQHRITHLLVKGHATVNGGRVDGNSFLEDAMAEVMPEYEKDVEEAIRNAT